MGLKVMSPYDKKSSFPLLLGAKSDILGQIGGKYSGILGQIQWYSGKNRAFGPDRVLVKGFKKIGANFGL